MSITVKLTQNEVDAINDMVDYLMANEHDAYLDYLAEGGYGNYHIYKSAQTMHNWIMKGGKK